MKTLLYSVGELIRRPVGITDGSVSLVERPASVIDPIIAAHHYSRKATPNRALSFAVTREGCEGTGAIRLGYGIRPHSKGGVDKRITKDNYMEFDRMWLPDSFPKFSETRTIALLVSYLKQTRKAVKFLITYADGSAGNVGTIYKASNAKPLGSIPCDFYVLASGERVHPVSMYHRHGTGSTYPQGVPRRRA